MGSAESMMKQIFENKKSPFYHFGQLCTLSKIPYNDFCSFLQTRFVAITACATEIAEEILQFTHCHPYYTQQFAFHVWMELTRTSYYREMISKVIEDIILLHDNDFERLWNHFNNTDKRVLIDLAFDQPNILSANNFNKNEIAASTKFSALKRLTEKGIVIKTKRYEIDDPFFRKWIVWKRQFD
jgi:hypothetical protein